jgi:hypothetical protein
MSLIIEELIQLLDRIINTIAITLDTLIRTITGRNDATIFTGNPWLTALATIILLITAWAIPGTILKRRAIRRRETHRDSAAQPEKERRREEPEPAEPAETETEHPPIKQAYMGYVRELITQNGDDPDAYDITAYFDLTLTLSENLNNLCVKYPSLQKAFTNRPNFTGWCNAWYREHREEEKRTTAPQTPPQCRLILGKTAKEIMYEDPKLGSPSVLEEYINSQDRCLYTTTWRRSTPTGKVGEGKEVEETYLIVGEIALALTKPYDPNAADHFVMTIKPKRHLSKEVRENAALHPMQQEVKIVTPPPRTSVSGEERRIWQRERRRLEEAIRQIYEENERLKREGKPALAIDPYVILGITSTATQQEIKNAYRRLTLIYHPDKTRNPKTAEMFRLITEAYEKLTGEAPPPRAPRETPPPRTSPPSPPREAPPPTPTPSKPPPEPPKTPLRQLLEALAEGDRAYYCPSENVLTVTSRRNINCNACHQPLIAGHMIIQKILPRGKAVTPYCCAKTATLIIGDEQTTHYCEACGEPYQLTHALTLKTLRGDDTLTFTLPPQAPPAAPSQMKNEPPPTPIESTTNFAEQAAKLGDDAVQWTENLADTLDKIFGRTITGTCPRCGTEQTLYPRERFCNKCGTRLR